MADTHGNLPASTLPRLREADEIWHLGDFCNWDILSAVQGLGPPFYGVLGNNDWSLDLPRHLMLERGGRTFFLIHIPPLHPQGADFLLHGHTHLPRDETVGTTRILNPGSIGKADKGAPASWAWLDISESGDVVWQVNHV